jgi:hypothetical protein
MEESAHIYTSFRIITLTELEGANNANVPAQKENQTDNVDLDWWVTVLIRVVSVRAI